MVYRSWLVNRPDKTASKTLSKATGAPPLVCDVLLSRGLDTPEAITRFIREEPPLSSPSLLKQIDAAVERIHAAVDAGERVAVFGDYDVDGVCSTALMYTYLESIGAEVYYKLPSRADDGYGLSKAAIDLIASKGITLVITVDNGISAYDEIAYAKTLGVDVIVTDHHLPPQKLPDAVAVIDPLQEGDESPCKSLAGVGVAFKVICAIEGCAPEDFLPYYADLVAIGTVADIMALTGENRVIVRHGIELLQQSERPGLRALLDISGFTNKTVTAENVSFAIAPRINAAGRMEDATAALRLLLTEDAEEAAALARRLDEYNQARQKTEQEIVQGIVDRIATDDVLKNRRVIVVWGEGYHPGVIGIVASRLVERFGRPAIVFSVDGDEAKGSGRSVAGFSLYTAISACKEILVRYGGHDLAAGMSVKRENLVRFSEMINEFSAREFPFIGATPIKVDAPVELGDITTDDVAGLRYLAPYGNSNPSPVFLLENATLEAVYPISDGHHSRLRLRQGGAQLFAVLFGVSPSALCYKAGDKVEALLSVSIYEGPSGAQISGRVRAIRPAGIGNDYVQFTELYRAFLGGVPLTRAQKDLILPSREETALVYRMVRTEGIFAEDFCPCFVKLAPLNAGKVMVALRALRELGLIEKADTNGQAKYTISKTSEKRNLADAPILKTLMAD